MLQAMAIANGLHTLGRFLVVCPATDTNYQRLVDMFPADPDGRVRMFTTYEAAYTEAVSGGNDVIVLAGNATHELSTGLAFTKSRVHTIGFDGGDRLVQQGAKIQLSGAIASAFVMKNTGVRNSFRNVKFLQSSTHATALTCVQFGGEGNLYKNCSFVFGVANNLGSTTANEVVFGEDSGTFLDCTFGSDTLLTSAARSVALIKQVKASQEFKSNRLRNCIFMISSSDAGAYLLSVNSTADVLFTNHFEACQFVASVDSAGGIALTNAVTSVASLVKGSCTFYMPGCFNCTNFSANNSTNFKVAAPAASNNAFEAVTPA